MLVDGSIVGEVCHIHGKSPGGARYFAELVEEEVHGADNLILLCRAHHKIVDDQPDNYSADWLGKAKAEHELRAAPTSGEVLRRLIEVLVPDVPEDWWEGASRSVTYRWQTETAFQGTKPEILYS